VAAEAIRGRAASIAQARVRRAARGLRLAALAALLAGFVPAANAAALERSATDDIRGVWVDNRDGDKHKVAVSIEDCDGLLCGRIFWLKKPLSGGAPKRDQNNPDAALRDRPLCGLMILTGFAHPKERHWTAGHIYNPNDGRTFKSTIDLENDGSLRIRGYVGLALFGKTIEWVRPPVPLERCR